MTSISKLARRAPRKAVAKRYDSEHEDAALLDANAPSISVNMSSFTPASSLSGYGRRRTDEEANEAATCPERVERIRGLSFEYDDIQKSPFASVSRAMVPRSNRNNDESVSSTSSISSSSSARSTHEKKTLAAVNRRSTTTTTTTKTTVVTTTLLAPTSSTSSSSAFVSPSDLGTRGLLMPGRPGRFRGTSLSSKDLHDDDDDEEEEHNSKMSPRKKNTIVLTNIRPGRMRGTSLVSGDDTSHRSNSSCEDSANTSPEQRQRWRVRVTNMNKNSLAAAKARNNLYSNSTRPTRTISGDGKKLVNDDHVRAAEMRAAKMRATVQQYAMRIVNDDHVRAAEMRAAKMRATVQQYATRMRSSRYRGAYTRSTKTTGTDSSGRSSCEALEVASMMTKKKAATSTARAVAKKPYQVETKASTTTTTSIKKPCRIDTSTRGIDSTPALVKHCQIKASGTPTTPAPRAHTNSPREIMAAAEPVVRTNTFGDSHRNNYSSNDDDSDDDDYSMCEDDSAVAQREEYHKEASDIDSKEECWDKEDYTEEEVEEGYIEEEVVDYDTTEGAETEDDDYVHCNMGYDRVSDPSVAVTEDITENTTQYDSADEGSGEVKEQAYDPYFVPFDELMRSRQKSRRVKDQIKLPGAMSLKDRLAMFQK